MPAYSDYVVRGKLAEATGHLADLRVKMEQYYADNRRYSTDPGGGTCGIPGGQGNTAADARYFPNVCESVTAPNGQGDQQYVLTAVGVRSGPRWLSFTVNHANAKQTTVV